jgi:hypothetical protein
LRSKIVEPQTGGMSTSNEAYLKSLWF